MSYMTYGMRGVVELPIQHEAKLSAVWGDETIHMSIYFHMVAAILRVRNIIAVIEGKVLTVSLFASEPTRLAYTGLCACILQNMKSCWSSQLNWRRAIGLAPFSQSMQYISHPQNGGYHTEVYGPSKKFW